jgi:putative ATPase
LTLFDEPVPDMTGQIRSGIPLADRMRPQDLDGFVGQKHLVGEGKVLHGLIGGDRLHSMILWGPPGSGKTTLARIIANRTQSRFISFSAVTSGIREIRDIMKVAEHELKTRGTRTLLFIDEIHRFNKAQQDAFLPYVENGTIILIGATTENPSFEVNSALLSRAKTYILERLGDDDIRELVKRAVKDKKNGLGKYDIKIDEKSLDFIARISDGDSRMAYNILQLAFDLKASGSKGPIMIDRPALEDVTQKKALLFDKNGEEHFNLISALHKSMRGSDPDAAAYWTVRMLEGGEDPMYILRRMIRFASEDVGLADPEAIKQAAAARQSFEFIGPPEGCLAIVQLAVYLSLAPKSNSIYVTYKRVMSDIKKYLTLPVPHHIRNAPTGLMKEAGYGRGYKYDHDFRDAVASQSYLPEKLLGRQYYRPSCRGFERELAARLKKIEQIKSKDR